MIDEPTPNEVENIIDIHASKLKYEKRQKEKQEELRRWFLAQGDCV